MTPPFFVWDKLAEINYQCQLTISKQKPGFRRHLKSISRSVGKKDLIGSVK
jgi:hypothetical protein